MADKEKTAEKSATHKEEKSVAKKEEKSVVRKQPNIFERAINSLRQYFKETIGELRKVSWPTRKEATYLTGVVIIVTMIMSTYLGLLDYLFTRLIALIFTKSAG
jgi:preprotein translocase subunit SecE